MDTLEKVERIYSLIRDVNDEPSEQPGLERGAVVNAFSDSGLTPPDDLVLLYGWHDGIYHLNAFLHFLPLAEAISSYRSSLKFKHEFQDAEWSLVGFPYWI
jgi:hypothetical protein